MTVMGVEVSSSSPHYHRLMVVAVAVEEPEQTDRILTLFGVTREQFDADCARAMDAWRAAEQAAYDAYQEGRAS